mgnify:FL=1
MEEIKMKKCIKCGKEKIASTVHFYKKSDSKDGLTNDCKECRNKNNKEVYKIKHPLKIKEIDEYKTCSCCNTTYPNTIEYFHIETDKIDGLHALCKICRNQNEKDRRNQLKIENINIPDIYTVYVHINKIDNKIYIGQTKQVNLNIRWANGMGYNHNINFKNAIEKYGWDNFEHEIIASGLTKEEAENFEKLLIEKLETTNSEKGYNVQTGGCYGFTIGNNNNICSKKVVCDDKVYNSIKECAEYYGIEPSTMSSWLRGDRKMSDDFTKLNLQYENESFNKTHRTNNRKIYCDGVIFNSIKDCANHHNIKVSTMKSWLSGKNRMPQKFKDMELRYYIGEDNIN